MVDAEGCLVAALQLIGNSELGAEHDFSGLFDAEFMLEYGSVEIYCEDVEAPWC